MADPQTRSLKLLPPGMLLSRSIEQTAHALQCGALYPIATRSERVEENGICFLVRVVSNLVRKDQAKQQQNRQSAALGQEINPFLPYDPDLFVADISETHLYLLNKFNVMENHLLIITRAFEAQNTLLTLADFEAAVAGLLEIDGLVFYNSGRAAGASQRHKHLQLVPLPLVPEASLPIAAAVAAAEYRGGVGTVDAFPFRHAVVRFSQNQAQPVPTALEVQASYWKLLETLQLLDCPATSESRPAPYNLLMTRSWMLIVPRSQEKFESISVNALGFAGTLLVRTAAELAFLKEKTALTILQNVAIPLNEA